MSQWAQAREYKPAFGDVIWEVAPHSPLACSMSQEIPFYGVASFMQLAGKKPSFHLLVLRKAEIKGKGILSSMPPMWLPDEKPRGERPVSFLPGEETFQVGAGDARWMMAELEQGWQPSITHSDWEGTPNPVVIKLSSVNFKEAMLDYLSCLKQLLSYGYDDIRFNTIYYGGGSSRLSLNDLSLLDKIIRYVEVDKSVSKIILRGYSDNYGTRRGNYILSIERLRAIETYLIDRGIPEKMIDSTAFGERNPAATNRTAKGRAKNRRVTVYLQK